MFVYVVFCNDTDLSRIENIRWKVFEQDLLASIFTDFCSSSLAPLGLVPEFSRPQRLICVSGLWLAPLGLVPEFSRPQRLICVSGLWLA